MFCSVIFPFLIFSVSLFRGRLSIFFRTWSLISRNSSSENLFFLKYFSKYVDCFIKFRGSCPKFIIIIILLIWEFPTPVTVADGFSVESERLLVSSILQDFSQYSGRSQQYCCLDGLHSFSYFQVLQSLYQFFLVTLPRALIIVSITVTFKFLGIFSSLSRSRYLSLFSLSFSFNVWSAGTAKVPNFPGYLLLLTLIKSGRLVEIKWSVCIAKSQKVSCVSFSMTGSGLCICHLFVWSNFSFFNKFQWITYTLCAVIYWLRLLCDILFRLYLHLLFCCVVSILALT